MECRSQPRVELDLDLGEAPNSAWCGVPILAWGGALSQPGWSTDLGLGGARSGFRDLVGFFMIFVWFYW